MGKIFFSVFSIHWESRNNEHRNYLQLVKLGVHFELNHHVSTEELETLKAEFDQVFIGAGMWESKTLPIPGSTLDGVVTAINFLDEAKKIMDK